MTSWRQRASSAAKTLSAESFILHVGAWAEAELIGVEVLRLTDDVLELAGKIANYRFAVALL